MSIGLRLPEFHRAYVVSDLHLGGTAGFQMFSEAAAFEVFGRKTSEIVSASEPTLLVINGDFVDFLAEPQATYWNGNNAERMLREVAQRAELAPVFAGLSRFVAKPGARLVITLGNHDLELSRPAVRQVLVELLSGGVPARAERIEFCFDGWGYRFQVAGIEALATHGNEVDEYNFTRYDILNQIIREEQLFGDSLASRGWKPSAGTVFVVNAINQIKAQFPFVDLLKPETLVFLSLSILSPQQIRYIDDALEVKSAATSNERQRPSSERRFLRGSDDLESEARRRSDGPAPPGTRGKVEMIEDRAANLLRDLDPRRIDSMIYGLDDQFLGGPEWYARVKSALGELLEDGIELVDSSGRWVGDQLSRTAKLLHAKTLSKALSPHLAVAAFDVEVVDDFDRRLQSMIRRDYDVVFTGHTHARRFAERPDKPGQFYVNTGTWAGVMRLFPEDVQNASAMMPIYELMIGGDRQRLLASRWVRQERPVAVIEPANKRQVRLRLARVDDAGEISRNDLDGRAFETVFDKR